MKHRQKVNIGSFLIRRGVPLYDVKPSSTHKPQPCSSLDTLPSLWFQNSIVYLVPRGISPGDSPVVVGISL